MSEDRSANIVKRLRNSVMLLKENYRQAVEAKTIAEAQVEELKAEIVALKKDIAQSKTQLNDVKTEQQRLIAARGFVAEEGDIKSARLRVNRLVREIDNCISLLNE
jgi:chromosome segregation ATPase